MAFGIHTNFSAKGEGVVQKWSQLTVRYQRHRDDGDPPANERGKRKPRISASYC
jgi:hypothetical protein